MLHHQLGRDALSAEHEPGLRRDLARHGKLDLFERRAGPVRRSSRRSADQDPVGMCEQHPTHGDVRMLSPVRHRIDTGQHGYEPALSQQPINPTGEFRVILAADHSPLRSQDSCDLIFGRHVDTLRTLHSRPAVVAKSVDGGQAPSTLCGTSARLRAFVGDASPATRPLWARQPAYAAFVRNASPVRRPFVGDASPVRRPFVGDASPVRRPLWARQLG
jgi:hypothetical protein